MRLARRSIVITVTLLASGCETPSEQPAPVDRSAIVEAVRAGMLSYAAALTSLDSARVLGHYVAGPEFRLVSDGTTYSFADMQGIIGDLRTNFRASEVRWDTVVVTPMASDAAFVYAPFRRADTDMTGAMVRIRGVATWVWVQRDGAWRMLYGHGDHYPDTSSTP